MFWSRITKLITSSTKPALLEKRKKKKEKREKRNKKKEKRKKKKRIHAKATFQTSH
jgi:hypothetical protein